MFRFGNRVLDVVERIDQLGHAGGKIVIQLRVVLVAAFVILGLFQGHVIGIEQRISIGDVLGSAVAVYGGGYPEASGNFGHAQLTFAGTICGPVRVLPVAEP